MNTAFFLARRLSLSSGGRKKAPAVSVAIAAVALSVAVMSASICIVLGFKHEIREKIVGFNGHITLYPNVLTPDDDNLISMTDPLTKELESIGYVKEFSIQAAVPAILKTNNDFKGIYLKGLNGDNTTSFISRNLEEGTVADYSDPGNKNKIVISRTAARELGLKTGDKIDTYFITDDVRVRRLEITGVFNTHFDQYDDLVVYGSLPLVQQIGEIGDNQGTYIQVITDDFNLVQDYTFSLTDDLNEAFASGRIDRSFRADNVLNQGTGYFSWLSLLDTNVVVVLVLMMIVGCVTLVSGMLIIILERKKFIGIMKAMGSPTSQVRNVFVFLALRIAILGMVIGNVLILAILLLQEKYHFIPLDPESYYIDFVPVQLSWGALLLLNAGVLVVTYLVLILPSRFVAGISPAETMRYE